MNELQSTTNIDPLLAHIDKRFSAVMDRLKAIEAKLDDSVVVPTPPPLPPIDPPVRPPDPPDQDAIHIDAGDSQATIQNAINTSRDVYFPAGETVNAFNFTLERGGTPDKQRVIGVYGDGDRPRFNCDGNGFFVPSGIEVSFVNFAGLDFYAYKRDYNEWTYDSNRARQSCYGINWLARGTGLRVDDCRFRFFTQGMNIGSNEGQDKITQGAVVDKSIFHHCWGGARAQGLVTASPRTGPGLTLTDSVFYHNGWRPGGERGQEAHNIYIDDPHLRYTDRNSPSAAVTVRGVLSISGSSHGMKCHPGGVVSDSVFARNAIGFFVSGNDSMVKRNTILQSTDLNQGWGDADNRGGGFEAFWMDALWFEDNVIAHCDSRGKGEAFVSKAGDTTINRNTVHDWRSGHNLDYRFEDSTVNDLGGNIGKPYDTTAQLADPNRDLGSYALTTGYGSEDRLIEAAINRPRGQWDDELDPANISAWIRQGYRP